MRLLQSNLISSNLISSNLIPSNLIFLLLWPLTVVLLASGCATTGGGNRVKNYELNPISTRLTRAPSPSECPASDRSWRRERLSQVINHANNCALLKRWDRVEVFGEHLAQSDPWAPWGAYYLSLAAQGRGELVRALWMADLSLKKSPATALFHYQKARVHWELKEYDAAIDKLREALSHDSKLTDAHLLLGQVYFRDKEYRRATQHFNQVLAVESNNSLAMVGLAEIRLAQGAASEAVALYVSAINLQPRNLDYRFRVAYIYEVIQNDLESALSAYRRIDSFVRENRIPAASFPVNLKEKIEFLESSVSQTNASRLSKSDRSKGES